MNQTEIRDIVDEYLEESAQLVPILQDIHRKYGYLPEETLHHVAERLHIPLSRVYSVATFYGAFSLKPRGRHLISLCMGTACHLQGAPRLLHALKDKFKLEDGETSPDERFTLKVVNCLGTCALAPVVVVDGTYFDGMNPDKLLKALRRFE
ncbi:MAG: NAD(P)H-dependent oxidoreductase subunit E [Planctomycetes bacterium]|nr:NAD(P)H-dependent oxidoreductase subunit E [Planctomycetota bacterium]